MPNKVCAVVLKGLLLWRILSRFVGNVLSLFFRREQGFFDEHGHADSLKAAVVSREYEALVAKQLQEQQRCDKRCTDVTTAVDGIPHTEPAYKTTAAWPGCTP